MAAAYYRAAADIALKAVEKSEASAVEFVRLSDEVLPAPFAKVVMPT